jgi:hypothetical protein
MNQKASKNQLQFPLLYNFAKDTPHVDDTFRNVEEINAPLLNDMIQPVWTKKVHDKSVFDANGNEYYIDDNFLYKNGTKIYPNAIPSWSLTKSKIDSYKKYITFDRTSGNIGGVYYSDGSLSTLVIQTNSLTTTLNLYNSTLIDARTRIIDGVFWHVLYVDDGGTEYIHIYKGNTRVYYQQARWVYQRRGCQFYSYTAEPGGAAPCINMAVNNGLFYVSFTKKAGTVNDLYNGSAFITLFCNASTGADWKQIGYGTTYSNTTESTTTVQNVDVYGNSSSSMASSSVKVITADFNDYYFYNSSASYLSQCQKCTYIPKDYGNAHQYDIGQQDLKDEPTSEGDPTTYYILQFTLYTKTYSWWLSTRDDCDIKITDLRLVIQNVNDDGVAEGSSYTHQMPTFGVNTKSTSLSTYIVLANTDWSRGKAVITMSYRYLSGQAEPYVRLSNLSGTTGFQFRVNDGSTLGSAFNNTYWNSGISASNNVHVSSSTNYKLAYAPCIVLDDGNFYTLFRPEINTQTGNTENYWPDNCKLNYDMILLATSGINWNGTSYSVSGYLSGRYVYLNNTNIVRSGSIVIDQNLYAITLKLCNEAALNPTSLNNGKSESSSSRFAELEFDNTRNIIHYLPGTSRLGSFNYYSNAVNGDPTLAGPGEDLAVFTVSGHRTPVLYNGNYAHTNSHYWGALYNVTTAGTAFIQGLSYNNTGTGYEGTLVTPWQSIDENSYVVNAGNSVMYKDKAGDVWEISAVNRIPTLKTILEDRLIVWNTTDYINCYDTESNKFFHYASDYNGRLMFGDSIFRTLPGAIASDSKNWAAFPYIRYTANGKNPLYQVMPRDRVMSIILPIVARYRCYVDYCDAAQCTVASGLSSQPIDVFYSKLSSTACIYRYSIEHHSGIKDSPINHRLQGLTYPGTITTSASLTPNIFTEYVDGAGNNDLVIDGYDSYVMTYYDNEPYLVYSASTQASNVYSERDSFFVLQGQFYGIVKDKLYALTYSNGAISQMDAIIDLGAIKFIGNTPTIAFFWDPSSRTIRSFTGDANLDTLYHASKFTNMATNGRHWYDETTQSIFVDSSKGLLVFGPRNTYLIDKFQDVENVQFTNDGITHITLSDGSTYNMIYYKDTGYTVEPIDIETSFYGLGANEYTNIDRWDITLFNPEEIENATLKAGVRSLTDVSVVSEEKEFKITKDMYDKFTEAVLIRYVPKLQKGQGIRLYLETPLVIQKIVPHVADMGTGTVTRRGM